MQHRRLLVFVLLTAGCLAGCDNAGLGGGGNAPPVFDQRSYDEARRAAADAGKLFVVDAMAEWCGPCKEMDRTTWRDEQVVAWLNEHAIAVQVDVDHQQQVASALSIRAMPTIIAIRGDQEVARMVGGQEPGRFLAWLKGLDR